MDNFSEEVKSVLTKKVNDSIMYRPELLERVIYCIKENLGTVDSIEQLGWALEQEMWRYMEGNLNGSMPTMTKNNASSRKTFDRWKRK